MELRYYDVVKKTGYVFIDEVRTQKGGVYYFGPNLRLPKMQEVFTDFELGTNYINFTAFRDIEKRRHTNEH